jgi:tryptophan halogenase
MEEGAHSLAATACTVGSARDEIALLFGNGETGDDPGGPEASVRWLTRIVLRPRVARGLASALRGVLARGEAMDTPGVRLAPPEPTTSPSALLQPTSDANVASAHRLLHLVRELGVPFGFERSVKLSRHSLQGNRFLATVSKGSLGAGEALTAVCRAIEMPESLLETFRAHLSAATFAHFGFEEAESSCLYKVYLEFWSSWEDELARRSATAEPFLLHLGLKWDRRDAKRAAVTRYTCHPWLSADEIRRRLDDIYADAGMAVPRQAVCAAVGMAALRTKPGHILYLDVREDENPRHSFDLNLYKAGLRVQDLDPWIPQLGAHYTPPAEQFRQIFNLARPRTLGHIAGGVDRQGRDFLTIYYGMQAYGPDRDDEGPLRLESGRLGSVRLS